MHLLMSLRALLLSVLPCILLACSSPGATPGATMPNGTPLSGDAGPDAEVPVDDAAIDKALEGRPYKSFTPTDYEASKPAPLVILLHGYTGSGAVTNSYLKLSEVTSKRGIFLAYSDGTADSRGSKFWNATDSCCNFFGSTVDDVAYLGAVISDMQRRFAIDPKRVFVMGHSNGGFMAHRLACDLSTRIAGIASLAGGVYLDAAKCAAAVPVSVLQIHGTADATVKYGGGVFTAGVPPYPGAKDTVKLWASKNGCDATLAPGGEPIDIDTGLPGAETTVERHACTQGAAELWTIKDGVHIPTVGAVFSNKVLDFLMAHPKP
jgi:polyhydroxybutyrate depolymerase